MDGVGGLCKSLVGFKEAWYNEVDSCPTNSIMTHSCVKHNRTEQVSRCIVLKLCLKLFLLSAQKAIL